MQLVLPIALSNKITMLGPWLKFLSAKCSFRTGEDDGLMKKIQESFLGVEICPSIVAFFIFSRKIVKVLILFHKILHENSI